MILTASNPTWRAAGSLLLNLLAALVGTYVAQRPLVRYIHLLPPSRTAMLEADLLIAVVAFGLGFAIYRRWQPEVSKWLWLAGVCWYLPRALLTLKTSQGSVLGGSVGAVSPNFQDLVEWVEFTDPCLRTVFYSAGAFCCSLWLSRARKAPDRPAQQRPAEVALEGAATNAKGGPASGLNTEP